MAETFKSIPVRLIAVGPRLRGISEATIQQLMPSIREVGLLKPILVRPGVVYDRGVRTDGYELVAGQHRLVACQRLDMEQIDAKVVDLNDDQALIAECDENLIEATLSEVDRARFTKQRKAAYERLHPETKDGGDRKSDRQLGDLKNVVQFKRFTAETSGATGRSERAIQRDAERGEKVTDEALELIRGTVHDTGKYLDKLKKVPAAEQVKTVKADLSKAEAKAKAKAAEAEAKAKAKAAKVKPKAPAKPKAAAPAKKPAPPARARPREYAYTTEEQAWARAYHDEGKTRDEVALEFGVPDRAVRDAAIKEIGARHVLALGKGQPAFTNAELSTLLYALHEDQTTPERRKAALKLVNEKRLLLLSAAA